MINAVSGMVGDIGGSAEQGEAPGPANSLEALVSALEDIKATTISLIEAYHRKLASDPPSSGRLTRWQSRALSALRAARKAEAKTDRSIQKLRQRIVSGD